MPTSLRHERSDGGNKVLQLSKWNGFLGELSPLEGIRVVMSHLSGGDFFL